MNELVGGFLVGKAAFELFGLDVAQDAPDLGSVAEVKVADEIVSVDEIRCCGLSHQPNKSRA